VSARWEWGVLVDDRFREPAGDPQPERERRDVEEKGPLLGLQQRGGVDRRAGRHDLLWIEVALRFLAEEQNAGNGWLAAAGEGPNRA
jgi:hypothetical protein